jgi:hypothetical protein
VSQSNRTFLLDGELALEVSVTKPLENIGVNPMTTLEELEKRKKSVVRIVTKDNDCLLRAITVGIYYHENDVKNRKLRDKIREVCFQKKNWLNNSLLKLMSLTGNN